MRSPRTFAFLPRSNRAGAVALTIALQMAAIYAPFMNNVLGTVPLAAWQLTSSFSLSRVIFILVEGERLREM
ncbi:cation transporting ATPase C-terminal domain-containing protein [Caballeronia grimmiae]|uniref:cation transporting ATPase C-terminal domain-containing protein n=1 Tax=Caballeronia grimmiae TaxID=1071679 RepID=UPI0038B78D53